MGFTSFKKVAVYLCDFAQASQRPRRPGALPQCDWLHRREVGLGMGVPAQELSEGKALYSLIGLCEQGPALAPGYPAARVTGQDLGLPGEMTSWLYPFISQTPEALTLSFLPRGGYAQRYK